MELNDKWDMTIVFNRHISMCLFFSFVLVYNVSMDENSFLKMGV